MIDLIFIFLIFNINQNNKEMIRIETKRLINKFIFVCKLKTQINHNAVANIGNAKNSFNVIIQLPGFGSNLIKFGDIDKTRYGIANPIPSDAKIGMVIAEGCISAYPRAAPINGAVHGDATMTARTPVKKDPLNEFDPILPSLVRDDPIFISVNKITPIKNIKILNILTISGDWS